MHTRRFAICAPRLSFPGGSRNRMGSRRLVVCQIRLRSVLGCSRGPRRRRRRLGHALAQMRQGLGHVQCRQVNTTLLVPMCSGRVSCWCGCATPHLAAHLTPHVHCQGRLRRGQHLVGPLARKPPGKQRFNADRYGVVCPLHF